MATEATSQIDADRAEIMRIHRIWIRANETWELSGLGESVAPEQGRPGLDL